MNENFALYRGQSGAVRIVDYHCPHRGAPLHLGWVEDDAIRCVYHGWKFDCAGQCVDQPAEEAGFARKVSLRVYPAREHLGLIFGYFGPGEAPPFPHFPHRATDGIIQWRRILLRELRAIADGQPPKTWKTPPADVVPTLGF
jgi:phenylpropionate dioxygenase-like ring-hydroxylating dioxygenase large terminal subunit